MLVYVYCHLTFQVHSVYSQVRQCEQVLISYHYDGSLCVGFLPQVGRSRISIDRKTRIRDKCEIHVKNMCMGMLIKCGNRYFTLFRHLFYIALTYF